MEVWIEIVFDAITDAGGWVTSLVEVWIEIQIIHNAPEGLHVVTSLVEVWIEIRRCLGSQCGFGSLPLWKCGLKSVTTGEMYRDICVTSLVEVWIEILQLHLPISVDLQSLPLWKCGLK